MIAVVSRLEIFARIEDGENGEESRTGAVVFVHVGRVARSSPVPRYTRLN